MGRRITLAPSLGCVYSNTVTHLSGKSRDLSRRMSSGMAPRGTLPSSFASRKASCGPRGNSPRIRSPPGPLRLLLPGWCVPRPPRRTGGRACAIWVGSCSLAESGPGVFAGPDGAPVWPCGVEVFEWSADSTQGDTDRSSFQFEPAPHSSTATTRSPSNERRVMSPLAFWNQTTSTGRC